MVLISGKGAKGEGWLERFDGKEWTKVKKIDIAFSGSELEGNSLLSGRIFVLSEDWLGQRDLEEWENERSITIMKINQSGELNIRAAGESKTFENKTLYWNGTWNFGNLTLINCTVIVNGTLDLEISGNFYMDSNTTIDASGTGYAGGAGGDSANHMGSSGEGPGGGAGSGTGGGGGGAYGNYGGDGGNGGAGGTPYGTQDGDDIDMGSGGGGGAYHTGLVNVNGGDGGNGGGCVKIIVGGNVSVFGEIKANGQNGAGSVNAGGGGSGGGILLRADNVTIDGYLNATGGNGGYGVFGNGGGGGSGGRIKIFYRDNFYVNTTGEHLNVSEGAGGGGAHGGNNGYEGTVQVSKVPEMNVEFVFWPILLFFVAMVKVKNSKRKIKRRNKA